MHGAQLAVHRRSMACEHQTEWQGAMAVAEGAEQFETFGPRQADIKANGVLCQEFAHGLWAVNGQTKHLPAAGTVLLMKTIE